MTFNLNKLLTAGFFAGFICIGAFIRIPFLFVPATLQFLFVNLAILCQDRKYGVLSVLAYMALGLAGLPVFAAGGGLGYIFRPTFGYIIGFLAAAAITGTVRRLSVSGSLRLNLIFSAINIFIVYFFGLTYFYIVSNYWLGNQIGFSKLLVVGCLVFIPSDALSGLISSYLAVRLKTVLKREIGSAPGR